MNRWKMAIQTECQINFGKNRTHLERPSRDMSIEGDADAVDDLPQVSNFALFILQQEMEISETIEKHYN
jgi:hypothetical protein